MQCKLGIHLETFQLDSFLLLFAVRPTWNMPVKSNKGKQRINLLKSGEKFNIVFGKIFKRLCGQTLKYNAPQKNESTLLHITIFW